MAQTKKTGSAPKRAAKLSTAELAEANVYPHGLNRAAKAKEDEAFLAHRKKHLLEITGSQQVVSRLLQLKFQLEDYIQGDRYNPLKSFSFFLNAYLKIIDRRKKDFAEDIQIHETKLSQVLNNHVEPNEKLFIRLEIHSNNIFPAFYWYKLQEKKREFELNNDNALRVAEKKHVMNRLKYKL